jgi:hypothetical protein
VADPRKYGEYKMKEKGNASIDINITDSLELQARNVGNAIANGMMQSPDGINHKGETCKILTLPVTCMHGECSTCWIKEQEHVKALERQNTEMTRGY